MLVTSVSRIPTHIVTPKACASASRAYLRVHATCILYISIRSNQYNIHHTQISRLLPCIASQYCIRYTRYHRPGTQPEVMASSARSRLSKLAAHFIPSSSSPTVADSPESTHRYNFHTLSPTFFLPRAAAIEPHVCRPHELYRNVHRIQP